jgi:cbb3-type cytochrome oxidase subunit 3
MLRAACLFLFFFFHFFFYCVVVCVHSHHKHQAAALNSQLPEELRAHELTPAPRPTWRPARAPVVVPVVQERAASSGPAAAAAGAAPLLLSVPAEGLPLGALCALFSHPLACSILLGMAMRH